MKIIFSSLPRFRAAALAAIMIAAALVAAFRFGAAFTGPSSSPPTGSGAIAVNASNQVGIGITSPTDRLHIQDEANALLRLDEYNNTDGSVVRLRHARGTAAAPSALLSGDNVGGFRFFGFQSGGIFGSLAAALDAVAEENFTATAQGTYLRFRTNPSGAVGTAEAMRITGAGNVGIGTTTPATLLSVGNTTTSLVAVFGGGTGKINAGTIDPIYHIGGEQYATYLAGMTGVKEETAGILSLAPAAGGAWSATIDFMREPRGSDLWLFSKTTDLKNHFSPMAVLLTPAFDGATWYEKDAANQRLMVYAKPSSSSVIGRHAALEVSYRLTAPRFDTALWPNLNHDEGSAGFVIDE